MVVKTVFILLVLFALCKVQAIELAGNIINLPQIEGNSVTHLFKATNGTVVKIQHSNKNLLTQLHVGDILVLQGKVHKNAYGLFMPHAKIINISHNTSYNNYKYPFEAMREYLRNCLQLALPANKSGVLGALLLGDKSYLSEEELLIFKATGILHLLAVSGLHVGLVYMFSMKFVNTFCKNYKIASICALLISAWYAIIAGFSWPTMRALIMLSLFVARNLWYQYLGNRQVLLAAFIIIILFDLNALASVSFWLSFVAVACMFYFQAARNLIHKKVRKSNFKIKQHLYNLKIMFFGLMPISIKLFAGYSVIGPVINFFTIPWVSLVTVPALLISVLLLPIKLGHYGFIIAQYSWQMCWYVIKLLYYNISWCYITVSDLSYSKLILLSIGCLACIFLTHWPRILLAWVCIWQMVG